MCLSIPGRVVKISGKDVVVDYGFTQRSVMNLLFPNSLHIGDYVLVYQKMIVDKVDEEDALKILDAWDDRC